MFLQTNSHRLWCVTLLVSSLVFLGILFFRMSGVVQTMIALAAVLVSFGLLLSELYLSRRLALTRSVLANIEKELSMHMTEYLGQSSRRNGPSDTRSNPQVPIVDEGATNLWPVSLMSGRLQGSSLLSADTRNWILFIHGLVAYSIMIPLGLQVLSANHVGFFGSALSMAFLFGLLAFSLLFIYVASSERRLDSLTLGGTPEEATDEGRKTVWRSVGAVLAVAGPFYCYALLSPKTLDMANEVWQVAKGAGSEIGFWVAVVFVGGLFMVLVSLMWRSSSRAKSGLEGEGNPSSEENPDD